ncbi:TPA: hypothetical protein ACGGE8_000356, partial [Vibrio cholerae]
MSWKNTIPSCFGEVDKIFASHSSEIEAAFTLLKEAQSQNVGWNEYLSEINNWLETQTQDQNHINE